MSSDEPTAATEPIIPVRKAFSDEVVERAQQFAGDLLQLVPELEGVAIVPSYEIPQDRLPFGVIMGRNGPLRQPAEIMHMSMQLHGCLRIQLENAFETIREIDKHMGGMQLEIANLQEQIDGKKQELQSLEAGQTPSPGGGATPGGS